jgi:hypothetical protein
MASIQMFRPINARNTAEMFYVPDILTEQATRTKAVQPL